MTTGQITILSIISLLAIFAFVGVVFFDREETKNACGIFQLFLTVFCLMICTVLTVEVNRLHEKYKNGCPEYEKIENAYKIKQP